MGAARAHGRQRRAVRPHSGAAWDRRRARRLAAFGGTIVHRQHRRAETPSCARRKPVRYRDAAAHRRRPARRQPARARSGRSRLRHEKRVDWFDPPARRTVWGTGTRRYILERAPKPHRSAAWSQRGRVLRRPAARHRGELQQLRSRGVPGTPRRVAAGDALGGCHARVLPAARVDARRGTAVRRPRRAKRERRIGRRGSRLGETVLSEPQRARQAVS